MNTVLFRFRRALLCAPLMLVVGLPELAAQPVRPRVGLAAPQASREPVGAVEDTLKACLSRIPKDGSIGLRMLAETSCYRDEADRKAIHAVPFRARIRAH